MSEQKVPTDFRRVTMMVNEIETPLKIYRDILGMDTFYDEEFVVEGNKLPSGVTGAKCRLVILQCNDPYIGMLGILQYIDPPLPETPPRPEPNRVQAGEMVLVMHHEDVDAVYEQVKDIEGVEIVSEPVLSEYPKGDGIVRVKGLSFFDPNGYFLEVNQYA